jgi:2-polyprenyl-3-methyl-5-hydroxy-6-metoxy-1,4-benzoquinol methylase
MAYNTTQLNPDTTFERHVYHRDQFAHYLRWTHVLKRAKIGMNILDYGCGTGNLAEVLYRNRYKGKKYIGLDIRGKIIDKAQEKFEKVDWISFFQHDLVKDEFDYGNEFDIITSFEVIEHIGKENANKFLENIKKHCNENTIILLSTPNYNENVGAAKNHIINEQICEFEHDELQEILEKYFIVKEKYGTFASQRDYKPAMNEWQEKMFEHLSKYYDSNLISNLMAPLFPEDSRNCMWILKLK